jgi:ubiquinone/menaquinone biosynthesis C-methylase UbiE
MEREWSKSSCHICGGELSSIGSFPDFLQVTSDCRPWKAQGNLAICQVCGTVQKPVTEAWLAEAEAIYGGYEIYSQSGGVEQSAFDQLTGAAQSRSAKLVDWLTRGGHIPLEGKLLDIGCGNGAFLRAFGSVYPNWSMTGLELNDRNQAAVEAIPGVESFHVGPVESLPSQFNLITLIHALEHIPQPSHFLRTLKEKLLPGGMVVIEVPNLKTSPFDILIADHCTHFTADTLGKVIEQTPLAVVQLEEDYVPKELTVAIQPGEAVITSAPEPQEQNPDSSDLENFQILTAHLDYLQSLLDLANSVSGPIGIFGTSIAGTWLAQSVRDKVAFFVDEDPNRIGRYHLDKPIVSPDRVADGSKVLIPLPPAIASDVANRLSHLNCEFLLPSGLNLKVNA